ncbi:uncharacterized protein LOC141784829 [Halichoeres trimaculatus]|uniref:uncharacterized protein LOC141784829 n=1 Tax=Halichoeres trimaculatus TaxID=147232 RepID=UPI003D9E1677
MSSEVCPFCGKTYKRLKSHLPHCKAASSSKTPPTKHNVSAKQAPPSSWLAADSSKPRSDGNKTTQTLVVSKPQSKKGKKVSEVSKVPTIAPQSASESSVLSSSSTKKKQKLSELIKTAKIASSTSLVSSPSPSQSPNISGSKKKSLRALIEAAKSKQASVEGIRSVTEDLPLGSNPHVADPVNSRINIQTESKTHFDKEHVKDTSSSDFFFTDSKTKNASNLRATKKKKAKTTKDTSLDLKETAEKLHLRDDFLLENEEEAADLSVNKMFSKSGSGHTARITLQDVKTTLARANGTRQMCRPSILSKIQTTDGLKSKISPALQIGNKDSSLITYKTTPDQLHIKKPQQTEIQSVKREIFKSQQAALIPFQQNVSSQSGTSSPEAPVSQVKQATPPPFSVSINESLKVGPYKTGLLAISPSLVQFSSPHPLRSTPQTVSVREEGLRSDGGSQLEVRRQNTAENGAKVAPAERSLGQVRLRELPEWLVCRAPTHPRDVVEMVQRGWQWYYKKYINVKKGGVGGVGMLLAGYCVLSYIWSYPHIKRDRWRKHH